MYDGIPIPAAIRTVDQAVEVLPPIGRLLHHHHRHNLDPTGLEGISVEEGSGLVLGAQYDSRFADGVEQPPTWRPWPAHWDVPDEVPTFALRTFHVTERYAQLAIAARQRADRASSEAAAYRRSTDQRRARATAKRWSSYADRAEALLEPSSIPWLASLRQQVQAVAYIPPAAPQPRKAAATWQ